MHGWFWLKIKQLFFWLLREARNASVAAVFSGLLAAVGAYVGAVHAQSQKTEHFSSLLNNAGVGYPALLFDSAQKETTEPKIKFSPENLQNVAVCEYFSGKDRSFRDIMDQYLKTYSACFIPVRVDDKTLEIRPNTFTGQLTRTLDPSGAQRFWCKCSPSQVPADQKPVQGG